MGLLSKSSWLRRTSARPKNRRATRNFLACDSEDGSKLELLPQWRAFTLCLLVSVRVVRLTSTRDTSKPRPGTYNIPTACTSVTCGCSIHAVTSVRSPNGRNVSQETEHIRRLSVLKESLASYNLVVRASSAAFHDEFTSWAETARSVEVLSVAEVSSTRPLCVKSNASTVSSDRVLVPRYSPRSTTPFDRTSRHPRW